MRNSALQFIRKSKKNQYLMGFLFIYGVGTLLYFLVTYSFYQIAPASAWFEYKDVVAVEHHKGEPLQFESTSLFKREVDVQWNDVLFCPAANGGRYFSDYTSSADDYKTAPEKIRDDGFGKGNWVYHSPIPEEKMDCYLRSNISIELPYGIMKNTVLISSEFTINN